jgi:hypothetical protein
VARSSAIVSLTTLGVSGWSVSCQLAGIADSDLPDPLREGARPRP